MGTPLLSIKNLSAWYSSEKRVLSSFSFELGSMRLRAWSG